MSSSIYPEQNRPSSSLVTESSIYPVDQAVREHLVLLKQIRNGVSLLAVMLLVILLMMLAILMAAAA